MDRLFKIKRKKTSKPSQQPVFLGEPTNTVARSSSLQAAEGVGSKGERTVLITHWDREADSPVLTTPTDDASSQIVCRDQVLESSTSAPMVYSIGHGKELISKRLRPP